MKERDWPALAPASSGETLDLGTEEVSASVTPEQVQRSLASGEVLAGRYVLESELGRGAEIPGISGV